MYHFALDYNEPKPSSDRPGPPEVHGRSGRWGCAPLGSAGGPRGAKTTKISIKGNAATLRNRTASVAVG